MERVLVVFQATQTKTESMALAFGLGAVEGGANIRLRHLADPGRTALEHQGYGQLRSEDIEWAEIIALAIESSEPVPELNKLIDHMDTGRKTADLSGKHAYIFGSPSKTPAITFAEQAFRQAGILLIAPERAVVSDDPQYIKEAGRKLAAPTSS